jgi:hypothetical protein
MVVASLCISPNRADKFASHRVHGALQPVPTLLCACMNISYTNRSYHLVVISSFTSKLSLGYYLFINTLLVDLWDEIEGNQSYLELRQSERNNA